MRLCIQNAKLSVIADTLGGELQSLRDGDGREYLWQGDARYWTGKAPADGREIPVWRPGIYHGDPWIYLRFRAKAGSGAE